MSSCSRLLELSSEIQKHTATLNSYFANNNIPQPSFNGENPLPPPPPAEILATQESLSEALTELYSLNAGPIAGVITKALSSSIGLRFILRYNIHTLVPLDARGVSFGDIVGRIGLPEAKVRRLLRHAMTDYFFSEGEGGVVVKAVGKWPGGEEPNEAAFNIANNTPKPIFTFFSEDAPERAARFKGAMSFHEHFPGLERTFTVDGFDWASLPENATVVDIGGSHGGMSVDLAKAFPKLKFVVQDLPEVIDEASAKLPEEVDGRVQFMAHDFFVEQPVKDADVYFMRFILHNWSDKYCLKILRALIPALKSGAKIVLNEQCLQDSKDVSPKYDRWQREADINMMAVFNSQERDEKEWVQLFKTASPKFELEEVRRTEGAMLDIIVLRWT
ncbi:hypothetical protein PRZ48_009027 [Zasmidium cellare]|uniref:O-methyltransferase C-terminal domain-containing protein n=1 Tax=Zasmidium cellare TaxID=395010 RepID=A0ABR0EI55_ZASCE|nr:hypothetical protein PRZ48_009027 [Zasmidium cellare]